VTHKYCILSYRASFSPVWRDCHCRILRGLCWGREIDVAHTEMDAVVQPAGGGGDELLPQPSLLGKPRSEAMWAASWSFLGGKPRSSVILAENGSRARSAYTRFAARDA